LLAYTLTIVGFRQSYRILASSINVPNSFDSISPPSAGVGNQIGIFSGNRKHVPILLEDDYPALKASWHRDVWFKAEKERKGVSCSATVDDLAKRNTTMRYAQDKNGIPINLERANFIRATAKGIWDALADNGMAPKSWKQGSLLIREQYNREMAGRFEELQLCANDWKAEHIAVLNYPSFYSNRFDKDGNDKKQENGKGKGRVKQGK
jgi:hypothetical protein